MGEIDINKREIRSIVPPLNSASVLNKIPSRWIENIKDIIADSLGKNPISPRKLVKIIMYWKIDIVKESICGIYS